MDKKAELMSQLARLDSSKGSSSEGYQIQGPHTQSPPHDRQRSCLPSTVYIGLAPLKMRPEPTAPKYAMGTKIWLGETIMSTSAFCKPNWSRPVASLLIHCRPVRKERKESGLAALIQSGLSDTDSREPKR